MDIHKVSAFVVIAAISPMLEDDVVLYTEINNCLDIFRHVNLYQELAKDHSKGLDHDV